MPAGFAREAFRSRNRFLLRIAIIAALGGFLFGYDTGIISGAQLYIKQDLSTSQLEQQWVVASLLVGAMVGAIVSGWSADRIGRRWQVPETKDRSLEEIQREVTGRVAA